MNQFATHSRHPRTADSSRFRSCTGIAVGLAALFAFLPGRAAAPATNTVNSLDESSFRIISDRNIFNSRRSARYVPSSAPRTRGTRSENFALVGTLSYEKGPYAFFDGSRSDYRKVLKPDDTIAGFKVVSIEAAHVKLASATNEIDLHVGMQLRREEEGEWRLSERPEVLEPSPNRGSSSFSRSYPSAAPSGTNSPDVTGPGGEAPFPEGGFGPEGGPMVFVDPQTGATNVVVPLPQQPAGGGGGAPGDILEALRRRAAAERGEAP